MTRIKIADLPKDMKITKERMKRTVGGYRLATTYNLRTAPVAGLRKPISWGGAGGDPTSPISWGGDGGEPTSPISWGGDGGDPT